MTGYDLPDCYRDESLGKVLVRVLHKARISSPTHLNMFVLFKRPHLPLSKHKPTRSHFHKELRHPGAARPCLPQLIEMSANPDRVRSFPKTRWILEGNLISVLQQGGSLLSSRLTEAVALQALF